MKTLLYTTLLLLMTTATTLAQNIASHQWKDRLLIVLTTDTLSADFKKQVAIFENHNPGLEERQLKIYLASPKAYKIYKSENDNWIMDKSLFSHYKTKETAIELVLIGLDGGIKLRKYSVTTLEAIFVIIDGMPMRLSEN